MEETTGPKLIGFKYPIYAEFDDGTMVRVPNDVEMSESQMMCQWRLRAQTVDGKNYGVTVSTATTQREFCESMSWLQNLTSGRH